MKHVKVVTKLPASADGSIPISTWMTFLIAAMTALAPVLAAKYPTST
jgi:hypothetical protein